jgi:hypothetical protein
MDIYRVAEQLLASQEGVSYLTTLLATRRLKTYGVE